MILDLEGQYKLTMEHASRCIELYREHIELYWICLPIHLRQAIGRFTNHFGCAGTRMQKSSHAAQRRRYGDHR